MIMKNDTILLLTPFEDCSQHRLTKHIPYKLVISVPIETCFYQPLQKIFSNVVLYDYWRRSVEIGINGVNNEIIELVKKEHPKYVLWISIGEYYEIKESTFEMIRKEKSIVIGWLFDVAIRFEYYSQWLIPYIDYFIVDDREVLVKFKELNAWATQAICTGPGIDVDWTTQNEMFDISFIGSFRANREQYINEIKKSNFSIHLFGESGGKFVSNEGMLKIYEASRINLNFSMNYTNTKLAIKARIFEVCLSGGFLLTEYFPGIEDYFEIDREIVCFTNSQEMLEKIEYYLNHDDERRKIAKAGWERANREYSAFRILSRVFQEIENDMQNGKGRTPQKLTMPRKIRKRVSDFYFTWGKAYLEENYCGFWKDTLQLSLSYDLFNLKARYYYISGLLPLPLRIRLLHMYHLFEKYSRITTYGRWAESIPALRGIKRHIKEHFYM